jgi:hypothetical protein
VSLPADYRNLDERIDENVRRIPAAAGDCIIFTEAISARASRMRNLPTLRLRSKRRTRHVGDSTIVFDESPTQHSVFSQKRVLHSIRSLARTPCCAPRSSTASRRSTVIDCHTKAARAAAAHGTLPWTVEGRPRTRLAMLDPEPLFWV